MTFRFSGATVVFDRDIRTDDAEDILNALRCIKGVINVEPIVADYEQHMAYSRARHDLEMRLFKALKEE
jgi:hypothetical protein